MLSSVDLPQPDGPISATKSPASSDSDALLLPAGAFLERTGGAWVFVVARDGNSAERRHIKVGRRTFEQLEVVSGLAAGERVITSDYTGLDRVDRIILER